MPAGYRSDIRGAGVGGRATLTLTLKEGSEEYPEEGNLFAVISQHPLLEGTHLLTNPVPRGMLREDPLQSVDQHVQFIFVHGFSRRGEEVGMWEGGGRVRLERLQMCFE